MKLINLTEEPTNVSGDGGFTDSANPDGPVAGYSAPLSGSRNIVPRYGAFKGKHKKENKKAIKQMMGESSFDYDCFRSTISTLREWYVDDYKIQFVDTDGKTKVMVVRNNEGGTKVEDGKVNNNFGVEYLLKPGEEWCEKCGSSQCRCGSDNYRKKQAYNKNIHQESTILEYRTDKANAIYTIRKAANENKKVVVTHKDGTRSVITPREAKIVIGAYEQMDNSNKIKYVNNINGGASTYKQIVDFSKNQL